VFEETSAVHGRNKCHHQATSIRQLLRFLASEFTVPEIGSEITNLELNFDETRFGASETGRMK
jgi:hypothetical protein